MNQKYINKGVKYNLFYILNVNIIKMHLVKLVLKCLSSNYLSQFSYCKYFLSNPLMMF